MGELVDAANKAKNQQQESSDDDETVGELVDAANKANRNNNSISRVTTAVAPAAVTAVAQQQHQR